jgi:hypothetical protein
LLLAVLVCYQPSSGPTMLPYGPSISSALAHEMPTLGGLDKQSLAHGAAQTPIELELPLKNVQLEIPSNGIKESNIYISV